MLTACMIDSREPEQIQKLTFGGIPTTVTMLEAGDLLAVTNDGCMLGIERKTPDDFLNSLKDDRLLPQLTRLASKREESQVKVNPANNYWPYLVITGTFLIGPDGHVVTDRGVTGWSWSAIQGALLTIQEMGVFITYAANDLDYESCIMRLGNRDRKPELLLLPPKPPAIVGAQAAFIAGLPGIGVERCMEIMRWAGNIPLHALMGLTDLEIDSPVPVGIRKRIRTFMGLKDGESIGYWIDDKNLLNVKETINGHANTTG